ncbi:hypothetical protein OROHE_012239 [Orobanche hederae]
MEFWGVEVKAGEQLKVEPKFKCLIHISQATLGETKGGIEGGENIPLRVKIDDKNFVIGALSADARPQVSFDLVFEKEFELSHDWKNGSVHFMGYVANELDSDDDDSSSYTSSDSEDLESEVHVGQLENGNAATAEAATKKEDSADDDSDDSDDDSFDSDDGLSGSDDGLSGEDAEEDTSSDEELPIPPKKSKKRPAESAAQPTPASIKKAKSPAPDKTVNKKVQNATPFPSKAAGKKPKQSPKSGAEFSGKSGNKFFDSKNSKNDKGKQRGGK